MGKYLMEDSSALSMKWKPYCNSIYRYTTQLAWSNSKYPAQIYSIILNYKLSFCQQIMSSAETVNFSNEMFTLGKLY